MTYRHIYHPEIQALDAKAYTMYTESRRDAEVFRKEVTQFQMQAGAIQQKLVKPIGKRYLSAQWLWSYGHIGLLHMLIKWFRKTEPHTKLIVIDDHLCANPHFFEKLKPFVTVIGSLPEELWREAENNAVYFACPDGKLSLHNFYKMVSRECPEHILGEPPDVSDMLETLKVVRPYIAFHARNFDHEPYRNTTLEQCEKAIGDKLNVINIGLDDHPINDIIPNVKMLPNAPLASFQLSASCDQFIGCNSGAWTVANAYGKPVELINDLLHKAWIYPEEIDE